MENVIVIGGGPAGLSAAIYLARANLNPLVFAGSPPGGQLTLTSEVENYPGFESILGSELIERMRNQAKKFGTRIIDENVLKVDFTKKPFLVRAIHESPLQSKSIIIATGAKALWLNLPSETRLRGKGVSACATCDGFFFREKTVAVIGGGDTALEEALTLTKFAKKVYIIHRRDFFRASKIMQDRVKKNKKIEVIWNSSVEEILGEKKVEGVKIKKIVPLLHGSIVKNKTTMKQLNNETIALDGVFVAIGHKPDTDLFTGKVELDNKGYIVTSVRKAIQIVPLLHGSIVKNETTMKQSDNETINKFDFDFQSQTSVPGVFAAGDCADPIYQQAATSVGTGVEAALDVEKYLEINN
jgi:thioredoxin reductase (NADPH)